MKIKNIFGGMICLALLASCGDEMDYHEYTNYDKDYVFTNFDNTVGFVTNIYGKLEDGFGPYDKGMPVMRLNIPGRTVAYRTLPMVPGVH